MLHNEASTFWSNLGKIQDTLLQSDEEFAKSLNIETKNFLRLKQQGSFLPLANVFELSEKHNFHFEDLLSSTFSLKDDQEIELLSRYSFATYSHTKPIINIINYLEEKRGTRAKINLLRKFQLSEKFIADESQKANIFLISDIVNYLHKTYQFTYEDFLAMGQRTPHVSENAFLKSKLTNHENAQGLFAQFFDECTHVFDKNCDYRLDQLSSEYAIVAAIPKKEVLEELEIPKESFANSNTAVTRFGVMSSITWFQYKKNAPVRRISSIYNGDKYDRYLFDLSPFKKPLSSNRLSLH